MLKYFTSIYLAWMRIVSFIEEKMALMPKLYLRIMNDPQNTYFLIV